MIIDWIKSEERLPEFIYTYSFGTTISDKVLIYRKGQHYIGHLYSNDSSDEKSWSVDDYTDFEVDGTYWMSLPNGPV